MSITAASNTLKAERQQLESRLRQINTAIPSLGSLNNHSRKGGKRTMSTAGLARIAAAQRARSVRCEHAPHPLLPGLPVNPRRPRDSASRRSTFSQARPNRREMAGSCSVNNRRLRHRLRRRNTCRRPCCTNVLLAGPA